jgi:hypothetical protein
VVRAVREDTPLQAARITWLATGLAQSRVIDKPQKAGRKLRERRR